MRSRDAGRAQSRDAGEVGRHEVDRVPALLARHAPGANVLVQVDVAGEPQKGGCAPADTPALVERLRSIAGRGRAEQGASA